MGVPLPAQLDPSALQQPVTPKQQHQLLGLIHVKRWALLCDTSYLWRYGDVSCGTAALPPRKSLPLHFWFLCRDRHVPRHGGCYSSACMAVILHEKTARLVVQRNSGKEEEVAQ